MLTRWDVWSEFPAVYSELDRFFSGVSNEGAKFSPSVDIVEGENGVAINAELPGISAEDLSIDIEKNVLTLKGERKFEHNEDKQGYRRFERRYGSFSRSFTLPDTIDTENIDADLKDGVLTIQLAKKEPVEAKKIAIKSS